MISQGGTAKNERSHPWLTSVTILLKLSGMHKNWAKQNTEAEVMDLAMKMFDQSTQAQGPNTQNERKLYKEV